MSKLGKVLRDEIAGVAVRRSLLLWIAGLVPTGGFGRVRRLIVRLAGIEIGDESTILGGLIVAGTGGRLVVGRRCFVNRGCQFDVSASITVGDGVSFGQDVLVLTNTHRIDGEWMRAGDLLAKPVTIGSGCWIGARSIILPGVALGRGAVVAAGAVVTSDVEPDTLVAGVPARAMRSLDPP